MKLEIAPGLTDISLVVFIQDITSVEGAGLTGLLFNSAGLACYYIRPGAAAVQLALANVAVAGAHADGGFIEIDATDMPGWYRLDLSDAIIAAGVTSAGIHLGGAANMASVLSEIQLLSEIAAARIPRYGFTNFQIPGIV